MPRIEKRLASGSSSVIAERMGKERVKVSRSKSDRERDVHAGPGIITGNYLQVCPERGRVL